MVFGDGFVFVVDVFLKLVMFLVEFFGLGLDFFLEDVDLLLLFVQFFLQFVGVIAFGLERVVHEFLFFLGSVDLVLEV